MTLKEYMLNAMKTFKVDDMTDEEKLVFYKQLIMSIGLVYGDCEK